MEHEPSLGRLLTEAFRVGAQATEFHGGVGLEKRISKLETGKLGKFSFAVVKPSIFETTRHIFGICDKEFIASLREGLVEIDTGAGKSGASFFSTQDNKYLLKVVKEDAEATAELAGRFLLHFQANPGTFIAPFYALLELRLKHKIAPKNRIVLVCMPNTFCKTQAKDLLTPPPGFKRASNFRRYDLKGLLDGRMARVEDGLSPHSTVYQDQDLLTHGQHVWTSSDLKAAIRAQLSADCRFLEDCAVIDYSLLLGVVKTQFVEAVDQSRRDFAEGEAPERKDSRVESLGSIDRTATGVRLLEGLYLPKHLRFHEENPEVAVEEDKSSEWKEVYLISIVDTLQTYNSLKAAESKIKNLYKNATIQSPQEYSQRFRAFMEELVKVDVQQEQMLLLKSAPLSKSVLDR